MLLACACLTVVQLGYWRNTECLFQHALEVTRDNYMAHNNLAADCYLQGNFEGAIEHYQASLAIAPTQPSEPQIRFYLGDALSKRGRYEEAAQEFTEVLAVRPNDVGTRVQLGITRARQGRNEEARQAFLEALRIAPNDPAALDNFGNLLAQQGRYAEAVQQFEVSLKAKPDNAAAHNNIAISLAKLNRLGDAINHYREAIRLQPDFLPPLNNLAWILAASPHAEFRNGAESVRLATAGCDTTKYQNPMLLTTLAAAYGEIGQFPEAISFAERAQGLAQGDGGPLAGRLTAMLESFRANRAYHAGTEREAGAYETGRARCPEGWQCGGVWETVRGVSVNPVRGGLFINPRPEHCAQTPSGVACAFRPLRFGRDRGHRSTPNGVWERD